MKKLNAIILSHLFIVGLLISNNSNSTSTDSDNNLAQIGNSGSRKYSKHAKFYLDYHNQIITDLNRIISVNDSSGTINDSIHPKRRFKRRVLSEVIDNIQYNFSNLFEIFSIHKERNTFKIKEHTPYAHAVLNCYKSLHGLNKINYDKKVGKSGVISQVDAWIKHFGYLKIKAESDLTQ